MMTTNPTLREALDHCPLIAILRGITPSEVEAAAEILVDSGFSVIEVPLNSPDALHSIELLARRYGNRILVGGGTVLTTDEVAALADRGAGLVLSPNCAPEVIKATVARGMISIPGYATPSEAFTALGAGASALKLFPAEAASPAIVRAHRAVLPADPQIIPVGGINAMSLGPWLAVADGLGVGSALYQPCMPLTELRLEARSFMAALRLLRAF